MKFIMKYMNNKMNESENETTQNRNYTVCLNIMRMLMLGDY